MRVCKLCQQPKSPAQFYAGVQSRCKDCHRARMKELRLTDPTVQERERSRAKSPKRKALRRSVTIAWRAKNPVAYKAQTAVGNALRDGKLKRQPCALCGTNKHVHGHHQDYSKPLDVTWLCAKCHQRLHATFPQLSGHRARA